MKRSISNPWRLIILLTVPLIFLWLISLREVRLQIGDHFYKRGEYAQAVTFYSKVMRKEKLWIDHNRGDRLKYEQDLSRLNFSLILGIEGILLKINQALGFTEIKDLKFLLIESTLFLKKIKELVGNGPKEQLLKMKEELEYFNNLTTMFKNLWEKKPEGKKLENLVTMGFSLKGIIDESEDNLISAYLNYEKAANLSPKDLDHINERKRKLVPRLKSFVTDTGNIKL